MQEPTRDDARHFHDTWQTLTAAEQRVVLLRCDGFGNPQTAVRLFITQATVKGHVTRILTKLRRSSVATDQPERSAMDKVCWQHGYETALSDISQRLLDRKQEE